MIAFFRKHDDWVILAFCATLAMCCVFAAGCMEVQTPPVPPVSPLPQKTGLAEDIRKISVDRNTAISALALKCSVKERTAITTDEVKAVWNAEYHQIVGNSVDTMTKTIKSSLDSAETKEERVAVWEAIKKGFEP